MGLGAKIGKKVVIHFETEIRGYENLTIGQGCIIGDNAILDARNGLTLGQNHYCPVKVDKSLFEIIEI